MIELRTLGRELRSRRRALRIPSAELARRIGVSPTYIWLIEQAKPRSSGEPSRPSEEVLTRWTGALGMDEAEMRHIRELAGYFDPERPTTEFGRPLPAPGMQEPPASPFYATSVSPQPAASRPPQAATPMSALRRWSGAEQREEDPEETIVGQVRVVLQEADRSGRQNEAVTLLDSFLQWLASHVKREP